IAEAVSLSPSQVRYWLRAWEEQRLGIFPGDLPAEPQPLWPGVHMPRLPLELRNKVGMLPDDSMAEAGRKSLLFHFERMLFNEPGSRLGEDIEAVHDMRVATRRMRSAFRLFAPFLDPDVTRPHIRQLQRLGRVLGEVRDLDVFKEKAGHFMQTAPEVDLSPLLTAWDQRLVEARAALIAHLDNKKFDRFVEKFHVFVITPGMGARHLPAPSPVQVRHIAPRLIYEHYEQVRAYEAVLEDAPPTTLHALRIDCKRLRYTLEFFEEVMGPEVKMIIKEMKILQDHLGDLNDAEVVGHVLQDFIAQQQAAHSGVPVFLRPSLEGVMAYASAKEDEKRRLMETFPPVWANFNRHEVRRCLALAVAAL
ncbi:MAG: CHAD domain-containing protein, partial [Anaerolineae bacterium]|nr:CHAD domain-containing protein [Anaerolineae bacterium]